MVVVVCLVFAGWTTSTLEALVFEIAISQYFDAICEARQHEAWGDAAFFIKDHSLFVRVIRAKPAHLLISC
jgi:hypothetical protein